MSIVLDGGPWVEQQHANDRNNGQVVENCLEQTGFCARNPHFWFPSRALWGGRHRFAPQQDCEGCPPFALDLWSTVPPQTEVSDSIAGFNTLYRYQEARTHGGARFTLHARGEGEKERRDGQCRSLDPEPRVRFSSGHKNDRPVAHIVDYSVLETVVSCHTGTLYVHDLLQRSQSHARHSGAVKFPSSLWKNRSLRSTPCPVPFLRLR